MDKAKIKTALLSLSVEERESLLAEIENEAKQNSPVIGTRCELLNNKIWCCPHCNSKKYRKHGIAKGSQ